MSTTTNHYDLIVLGADVAGLVAAALVARRGKRVLVLPHGHVDGTYRLGPRALSLDTAPVVHGGTVAVERVLTELGLLQQIRRVAAPTFGLTHHVVDDARIDLEVAQRNLDRELERLWPDADVTEAWTLRQRWTEATEAVMGELLAQENALGAEGFWGRRFLSRLGAQLPSRDVDECAPLGAGHPVRRMLDGPLPWLVHLTPAQLGKAAALRIGRLWSAGPDDLPSGERGVREMLLQRIDLHSGEVKRELRVAELIIKRGRVVGVSLLGKRDRYGCDHLIVASDPRMLLDKGLLADVAPRALLHTLGALGTAAWRWVMHIDLDERGITPAFDGMAVCSPRPRPSAPPPGASTTAGAAAIEDAAWVPDEAHGVGHIYVRTETGWSDTSRRLTITRIIGVDEDLSDLRERTLAELDERGVLPFCERWIRVCHSPHDGREADDGRNSHPELGPGSAMTLPMAPVYFSDDEALLGVGLVPTTAGVRGLSFASRACLPGLGLEGEFAAGTAAAALVASPSRSPLTRSSLLSKA